VRVGLPHGEKNTPGSGPLNSPDPGVFSRRAIPRRLLEKRRSNEIATKFRAIYNGFENRQYFGKTQSGKVDALCS
jgi:hypothetical protein